MLELGGRGSSEGFLPSSHTCTIYILVVAARSKVQTVHWPLVQYRKYQSFILNQILLLEKITSCLKEDQLLQKNNMNYFTGVEKRKSTDHDIVTELL
jgi:hypothetical protein